MKFFAAVAALAGLLSVGTSTIVTHGIPDDLNGSNFTYPWPVNLYKFTSQLQDVEMAFMDVKPEKNCTNGKTAVLLHGKNFCGPSWGGTARVLVDAGYRVILPDHIGFCKSSKPETYQFSLQALSTNVKGLLEELGIDEPVTVIGHSMGGMMTLRYGLMFPDSVEALVVANPIGLEDWKALGVPYQTVDYNHAAEANTTYASIKAYEQATYYVNTWNESYDVWVNMLVNIYYGSERDRYLYDQARIVDMVLTQEVVYEFHLITPPTLLLIGQKDTTAIGKQWSPPAVAAMLGHYDVLGKEAAAAIPNSTLIEFPDLGHAPQIQDPDAFHEALMGWLLA